MLPCFLTVLCVSPLYVPLMIFLSKSPLALQTRCENNIENEINRLEPDPSYQRQVESYKRLHPKATHRPVGPTFVYNCHGLTFASRRTQIWNPREIQKILNDDGYVEVERSAVMAGDIAVYTDREGDISHSGPVVEIRQLQGLLISNIYILSKWGSLHEVIHLERDCPYVEASIKYYRLTR